MAKKFLVLFMVMILTIF